MFVHSFGCTYARTAKLASVLRQLSVELLCNFVCLACLFCERAGVYVQVMCKLLGLQPYSVRSHVVLQLRYEQQRIRYRTNFKNLNE